MSVLLANEAPDPITQTTAFLKCQKITFSGPAAADCTFFYGTSDGGTVEANWQFSAPAGIKSGDIEFGVTVTGLTDHEVYYFRVKAVQATPETSWSTSALEFSTLSYPQKVCGSIVTALRTPIAALSGRWSDSICPASVKEHFRGGITPMYGVEHSHLQLTAHTTSVGSFTIPALTWNSTQPASRSYTPPSVSGGQIVGSTGFAVRMTPSAFDFAAPVDGEFWALKKGSWKFDVSLNINGNFYNRNPNSGGTKGGPYTVSFVMFPYSIYGRPKRALPTPGVNYQTTVSPGGALFNVKSVLRSDCFWFCDMSVEVWASQSNQVGSPPVTNVDIATVDAQCTRA